jgi:DNA (cytosine-5)-methyltransferase 1
LNKYNAIDLFSGCGGLSYGLRQAGFSVVAAFDNNSDAVQTYSLNFPETEIFINDIRKIKIDMVRKKLGDDKLHLLAGCPPCQGFSSIRRLNRPESIKDERNDLILEYFRFVKELKPLTIMMENVPGLIEYSLFYNIVDSLKELGYFIDIKIVNIQEFGVPQRRKRLVLLGSLLGDIKISEPTGETVTVREAIGDLESVENTKDPIHRIIAHHTPEIMKRIKATPKNGGSRKDIPEFGLKCHKRNGIGFSDIYGRLRWDECSPTITGGCLNPSKGRFLHPDEDRSISAREAAILQTFPVNYKFPKGISKTSISLLIGNALPPKFSRIQAENIYRHLDRNLNSDWVYK